MTAEVAERAFDPFFTTKPGAEGPAWDWLSSTASSRARRTDPRRQHARRRHHVPPVLADRVAARVPRGDCIVADIRAHDAPRLADDHSLFREALCHYLRQDFPGIEIAEAGTLEEGLRAVESGRPDAFLIDFVMPGMNGVDGVVRAKRRCPGVPIVVLSGNISQEDAQEAVRAAPWRHLKGPVGRSVDGSASDGFSLGKGRHVVRLDGRTNGGRH